MFKLKRIKEKFKNINYLLYISIFSIFIVIIFITIGFSVLKTDLNISGEVYVRPDYDIRIDGLEFVSGENEGYEQYEFKYSRNDITLFTVLPTQNSSVTYKIRVKNNLGLEYGIYDITGIQNNLEYVLSGYNLKDELIESSQENVYEFKLTIKYKDGGLNPDSTIYSTTLNFDFRRFFDVSYTNIPDSENLKSKILSGDNYVETISSLPLDALYLMIKMNGIVLNTEQYQFNNNQLTINNVTGNLEVIYQDYIFDLSVTGDGKKFDFGDMNFNANEQTFYIEVDLSNISSSSINENIISIGQDISNWRVSPSITNGVNLHIYYPSIDGNGDITISPMMQRNDNLYRQFKEYYETMYNGRLKIAFNGNGLYINGLKVIDSEGMGQNTSEIGSSSISVQNYLAEYFSRWNSGPLMVKIGSLEGAAQSYAVYKDIKIYGQKYSVNKLIELTSLDEDIDIPTDYTQTIQTPYSPNGSSFDFDISDLTNLSNKTIYTEFDISNMTQDINQDVFSFGNNISVWNGNGVYNIHIYYTKSSNQFIIAAISGTSFAQWYFTAEPVDNKYKLALSSNGFYINGNFILDKFSVSNKLSRFSLSPGSNISDILSNLFENFVSSNFVAQAGSKEGNTRSTAIYDSLRIYNEVLNKLQLKKLTS